MGSVGDSTLMGASLATVTPRSCSHDNGGKVEENSLGGLTIDSEMPIRGRCGSGPVTLVAILERPLLFEGIGSFVIVLEGTGDAAAKRELSAITVISETGRPAESSRDPCLVVVVKRLIEFQVVCIALVFVAIVLIGVGIISHTLP